MFTNDYGNYWKWDDVANYQKSENGEKWTPSNDIFGYF